jgi:cell division protein FtsB
MTLAQLNARLAQYLAAETKALESQEYAVGSGGDSRRSRRADLSEIRAEITSLNAQIAAHPENPMNSRQRRVMYLRPY